MKQNTMRKVGRGHRGATHKDNRPMLDAVIASQDGVRRRFFIRSKKCYVCESEDVSKVFINNRGVKHHYCKTCAEKYLVKINKDNRPMPGELIDKVMFTMQGTKKKKRR